MGYIIEAMRHGNRAPARDKPEPAATPTAEPSLPSVEGTDIDERLVALRWPSSIMAEEYRSIRTGLLARTKHQRHIVHMITSATPQEGKTITSLNLGLTMAELRNRKTIVVEADLRLPQFRKLFDLPMGPGMVSYLRGDAELEDVIQRVGPRGLHVIQAGERVSDQAVELLSRNRFTDLINRLKRDYDHIIFDTPPVVELADAGIIGAQAEDVMLIVRMNRTPRGLVEQAIRTLESYNAPVHGVIATDQTRHRRRYYSYRYGYRYGYRYAYGSTEGEAQAEKKAA